MSEPLTIARYTSPWEAHVDRALLQHEGIPAWVCDDNIIRMNWSHSLALGGVRLQVPTAFAEQAREVLSQRDSGALEQALAEQWSLAKTPVCPQCGVGELYHPIDKPYSTVPLLLTVMSLLGIIFPPQKSKNLRCRKCGATVEDSTQEQEPAP